MVQELIYTSLLQEENSLWPVQYSINTTNLIWPNFVVMHWSLFYIPLYLCKSLLPRVTKVKIQQNFHISCCKMLINRKYHLKVLIEWWQWSISFTDSNVKTTSQDLIIILFQKKVEFDRPGKCSPGLRSPGQSNSTYFWNDSWVQTFHNNIIVLY